MIRKKAAEGKSSYASGNKLGISKNTARKYREPQAQSEIQIKSSSKLDAFKEEIHLMMSQGIFSCAVMLERLHEKGYTGGISILKDYVHPFRPAKNIPSVPRYESLLGKQTQMDWGICNYIDGHKVPAFVMIPGSSRVKYVEFTKRCDLYNMERCMIHAFEYFAGIPEIVLTDNMKTVVDHREAKQTIWNTKFADFASDMGFVPKVCKVCRPQTKCKVKRLVQYVKNNFLPGRKFTGIVELEHTRELLETMGLTTAAELLDFRLEDASHRELTYLTFLSELLDVEQTERKRRSEETRIKLSRLPSRKTLEEFDFNFQPSIDPRQVYLRCNFRSFRKRILLSFQR